MLGQADFKDLVFVRNVIAAAYQGDFIRRQGNAGTVKGIANNRSHVLRCMKTNLVPAAGKYKNRIDIRMHQRLGPDKQRVGRFAGGIK